tara:strand:+ start:146 stop:562 length:417 start_codon:yes stop_codon:yes gene_type:complete
MKVGTPDTQDIVTIHIPMQLERRGGRKLIIAPEGSTAPIEKPKRDETMIRAIVKAHCWRRRIESGKAKSITDLAAQEGVTDAYVCQLLPLTCLAPRLVEAILDGRQPQGLKLGRLKAEMTGSWNDQCERWETVATEIV